MEWGFQIFRRKNVIRSKATVIYLAILFSKLQVSSHYNTDFGCLKVTVECKTFQENICYFYYVLISYLNVIAVKNYSKASVTKLDKDQDILALVKLLTYLLLAG